MTVNIDIDDADLKEAIQRGIKGLSDETITGLAKDAISAYLLTNEGIKSVLYKEKRLYYDQNVLRDELVDMLKDSFTVDEVKEYRAILFSTLEKHGGNLITKTLANVFVSMLMTQDAKDELKSEMLRIALTTNKD